jgi:hypothetical protein
MKAFEVWGHPVQGYEAVKSGWSWPGFFFLWIWAFIKKLWLYGVTLLAITVAAYFVHQLGFSSCPHYYTGHSAEPLYNCVVAFTSFSALMMWGIAIWAGVQGNAWRKKSLAQRGFSFVAKVDAMSPVAAISRGRQTLPQDEFGQETSKNTGSAGEKTTSNSERLEDLRKLGILRESGVLTEEEFQNEKRRIIGS